MLIELSSGTCSTLLFSQRKVNNFIIRTCHLIPKNKKNVNPRIMLMTSRFLLLVPYAYRHGSGVFSIHHHLSIYLSIYLTAWSHSAWFLKNNSVSVLMSWDHEEQWGVHSTRRSKEPLVSLCSAQRVRTNT